MLALLKARIMLRIVSEPSDDWIIQLLDSNLQLCKWDTLYYIPLYIVVIPPNWIPQRYFLLQSFMSAQSFVSHSVNNAWNLVLLPWRRLVSFCRKVTILAIFLSTKPGSKTGKQNTIAIWRIVCPRVSCKITRNC